MQLSSKRLLNYWGVLLLLGAHFFVLTSRTALAATTTLPKQTENFILAKFKFKQLMFHKAIDIYTFRNGKKVNNFGGICSDESLELKVYVNTSLKNVKSISLFLENPKLMRVAKYTFFDSSLPFIVSHYKKPYSGNLIVVIETTTALYFNQNNILSTTCSYSG